MNIKTKKSKKNATILICSILLMLFVIGGIFFYLKMNPYPLSSSLNTSNSSEFSFSGSEISGWWAADNYYPSSSETTDDANKIVSRNIVQGTKDKPLSCFIMYTAFQGGVDSQALSEELKERVNVHEPGLSTDDRGAQGLHMKTPEGIKTYLLNSYEITGNPSANVARGAAVGYIKLTDSYITIEVHCELFQQLKLTADVMSAVEYVRLR